MEILSLGKSREQEAAAALEMLRPISGSPWCCPLPSYTHTFPTGESLPVQGSV